MKLLFISCLLLASALAQTDVYSDSEMKVGNAPSCNQQQLGIIGQCSGITVQTACNAAPSCAWNSPACPLAPPATMPCAPMTSCTQVMGTVSVTFNADGSCGAVGTAPQSSGTASIPASQAGATILSATYGIDHCCNVPQEDYNLQWLQDNHCPVTGDASNFVTTATLYNPQMANPHFCNNPNLGMYIDAFALTFSMPVAPDSLNAQQFLLDRTAIEFALTDGRVVVADCAFMAPDNEADELYTVTLLGDWGDGENGTYHVQKVTVVNDFYLTGSNGLVNAVGLEITDYENMDYNNDDRGPHMLRAELGTINSLSDTNGCSSKYSTSTNFVKVMMDGGSTLDGVTEINPNMDVPETHIFRFPSAAGGFIETGFLGVADLGDRDNFFDLCLDDTFDVNQLTSVYMACDTALHLPAGRKPCPTQSISITIPPPPCSDGTVSVNGQQVPCSQAYDQAAATGQALGFCANPSMSTTCCATFNQNCVPVEETEELVEANQLSLSTSQHGGMSELLINGLAMIGVLSLIYLAITLGISDFKNDGFTHIPEENI